MTEVTRMRRLNFQQIFCNFTCCLKSNLFSYRIKYIFHIFLLFVQRRSITNTPSPSGGPPSVFAYWSCHKIRLAFQPEGGYAEPQKFPSEFLIFPVLFCSIFLPFLIPPFVYYYIVNMPKIVKKENHPRPYTKSLRWLILFFSTFLSTSIVIKTLIDGS